MPLLFLGTLGLRLFVPLARTPNLWGVPLVPRILVLSIAINIFLLGSIDKDYFIKFGVWSGIMLMYYIFGFYFLIVLLNTSSFSSRNVNVVGYVADGDR